MKFENENSKNSPTFNWLKVTPIFIIAAFIALRNYVGFIKKNEILFIILMLIFTNIIVLKYNSNIFLKRTLIIATSLIVILLVFFKLRQ